MVHTIAHFGAACHVFVQKRIHMLNVPKAAVLKPVFVQTHPLHTVPRSSW